MNINVYIYIYIYVYVYVYAYVYICLYMYVCNFANINASRKAPILLEPNPNGSGC